ncbi:putative retrotransposon protein [Tanacetum coccineum]|uniref:Retrotransposon protein n=1 Tax=Tanacetum coccineum TaxID=301880 RepID=A0ABQ5IDG6_9ASTR
MKSYLDTLERLGYAMSNKLGVSLILNSLNKDYDQFVQNYNMHSMGKTIDELHAMLKLHEKGIPKKAETPAVLAIREGKIQKDKRKLQGVKVELPPNGRTVGSKWLFKKKTDMDGNVHTFKALLVAKASRSWNKRFDVEIKKIGFTQNPDESYVYLKASRSSVAFLILYVDDILRMKNNVTMLQEVKSWLSKYFSMKDLGEATYILGIKIIRNRSKRLIALSQRAYLEKILKKFRMENSKKGYTPMMEKPDYKKSQCAKTPSEQNPGEIHWTAVKTILKYLRNTKDMVLVYGAKPEAELKVSSEYIAAAKASMGAVWMRKFIDGLSDVVPSNKRPIEILCDNEPAIAIAADPSILKGARHFQRKYHYIREVIQEREIGLKKVHTYDNVVDLFIKPMSFKKHFEHAMAIRTVHASSLM